MTVADQCHQFIRTSRSPTRLEIYTAIKVTDGGLSPLKYLLCISSISICSDGYVCPTHGHTDGNFTGNFFNIQCLMAAGGGFRFFRDPLALGVSGGGTVP